MLNPTAIHVGDAIIMLLKSNHNESDGEEHRQCRDPFSMCIEKFIVLISWNDTDVAKQKEYEIPNPLIANTNESREPRLEQKFSYWEQCRKEDEYTQTCFHCKSWT